MAKKTILHVAQAAIAKNRNQGTNDPAIIVNRRGTSSRHHEVDITLADGTIVGSFIYSPHKPLSCGARLWFEINEDVASATPRSA